MHSTAGHPVFPKSTSHSAQSCMRSVRPSLSSSRIRPCPTPRFSSRTPHSSRPWTCITTSPPAAPILVAQITAASSFGFQSKALRMLPFYVPCPRARAGKFGIGTAGRHAQRRCAIGSSATGASPTMHPLYQRGVAKGASRAARRARRKASAALRGWCVAGASWSSIARRRTRSSTGRSTSAFV